MVVDKQKTLEAFLDLIDTINPRTEEFAAALKIYMMDGSRLESPLELARKDEDKNVIEFSRKRSDG